MDALFGTTDSIYTLLVLAFVAFILFTWPSETAVEQEGGRRKGRRGWRNFNGRRDYYGYWGNYYNIFNPWRINNPCAQYAQEKCKGNYYYEPCYESKYFNCMNNTFYA